MSTQSNNLKMTVKQELFDNFFNKHEQENDIEQSKQIISELRKELRKLKNENSELREQIEGDESNQKSVIKLNEDFKSKMKPQIIKLKADLSAEKQKNKKIEAEFDKERKQLLKNINQLQKKINSNSKTKASESKENTINRFESLNSVDFSQLCDTISINSSDSSPRTSKQDFIQSNTETKQRKRNSNQISSNQSVAISKYNVNYCELSESESEETSNQPKKSNRGVPKNNSDLEKLTFNCKIEHLLSESIWSSFSPKKIERGVFSLKRKQMSEKQRKDIYRLDGFMETLIIRHFDRKTRTKSAAKIVDGYSIRRCCSVYACSVAWGLNINIKTGEGTLLCAKKCSHVVSAKEKSEFEKAAQINPIKSFDNSIEISNSKLLVVPKEWERIS